MLLITLFKREKEKITYSQGEIYEHFWQLYFKQRDKLMANSDIRPILEWHTKSEFSRHKLIYH